MVSAQNQDRRKLFERGWGFLHRYDLQLAFILSLFIGSPTNLNGTSDLVCQHNP